MTRIGFDFACNDPDNGLFSGRIDGIQLYAVDPVFELEPRSTRSPMIRLADDAIYVSGRRWPIEASRDWVGNWCWNRYYFRIDRAVDFMVWLHRREMFALTCGDSRLFDAWRWKTGLDQFRPLVEQLLIEAAS